MLIARQLELTARMGVALLQVQKAETALKTCIAYRRLGSNFREPQDFADALVASGRVSSVNSEDTKRQCNACRFPTNA
jgi:hypothetical protein